MKLSIIAIGKPGRGPEAALAADYAARATAAVLGKKAVAPQHIAEVAPLALRHRLRRNPLDNAGSSTRVERAVAELLPA